MTVSPFAQRPKIVFFRQFGQGLAPVMADGPRLAADIDEKRGQVGR